MLSPHCPTSNSSSTTNFLSYQQLTLNSFPWRLHVLDSRLPSCDHSQMTFVVPYKPSAGTTHRKHLLLLQMCLQFCCLALGMVWTTLKTLLLLSELLCNLAMDYLPVFTGTCLPTCCLAMGVRVTTFTYPQNGCHQLIHFTLANINSHIHCYAVWSHKTYNDETSI
jgi:hypothetical protein